ncbi:PTS sugar transporter subunit IIA [Bifidobacterium sp.]|jgi:PTS system fructose-specific IIC component|uniref:PTS sugar transporter subunit IIA n=1 Tax=Bifidobacterium sp. TaxID=41200 RepID=UPI0025C037BB|nr:PTS sugar transporter subunit IIA [Bifidobacterium sp.]MCH4208525.1 PTS sugar transporter subunit IIA [Bifidobacterium sp.]MCI1224211.1 PTS sugar transporter subunit IIA [Bifidobacterium sp.]
MKSLIAWEPQWCAHDADSLVESMAQYLESRGLINDGKRVAAALRQRESFGNTLIADNLAVPHAQSDAADEAIMLFVKLREALSGWQGVATVDRLIVTLLPERPSEHDAAVLKNFFQRLADERITQTFSVGECDEVRETLLQLLPDCAAGRKRRRSPTTQ